MMEEILLEIQKGKDVRTNLSILRREIKDPETKKHLFYLLEDISLLTARLDHEDPKTRKNAALLLGDLEAEEAAKAIYEAYCREEKLFVRSAYLEALAKTGAYEFLEKLREQYDKLCQMTPSAEEKKHVQEEIRALEVIFQKEGGQSAHIFTGWKEKLTILLTTAPAYREVTAEKVTAERVMITSLGVKAVTEDLREVIKIRTFRELLFPISLKESIRYGEDPELFGKTVAESGLMELLERCHSKSDPFYFRMEIRGEMTLEQRSKYAKRAAAAIEEQSGRRLLNSTGDYEFELRLIQDLHENIHVFLKMNTIPIERFSYRRNVIASSIQPSVAALFMELSKPYLKEKAQILDPCCGVGTLLIERNRILPAREIYGVDIFGEAIAKARENAEIAGLSINFINRDYLTFEHEYLFDEIVVNMPPRGKKSKEETDEFYRGFFTKSKELMAKDGIIIMYSNEAGFIKKQLRLMPEFRLLEEYEIFKKNHYNLYIINIT